MLAGDIVGYHALNTETKWAISFGGPGDGLPTNELSQIYSHTNVDDSDLDLGYQFTIPGTLPNTNTYMTSLTPEVAYNCKDW